mgnify:CR=1 FL=1
MLRCARRGGGALGCMGKRGTVQLGMRGVGQSQAGSVCVCVCVCVWWWGRGVVIHGEGKSLGGERGEMLGGWGQSAAAVRIIPPSPGSPRAGLGSLGWLALGSGMNYSPSSLPDPLNRRCDRVMVLRGGRLLALAGWRQVAALRLPELTAGQGGTAAGGGSGGGGGDGDGDGDGEEALGDGPTVDEVLDQEQAAAAAPAEAAVPADAAAVADPVVVHSGGSSGSSTAAAAGGVAAGVVAVEMVEAAEAAEAVTLELMGDGAADLAAKGAAAAATAADQTETAVTPTAGNSQYGASNRANRGSFMDRYRLSMSRTFAAGRANGDGGGAAIGRSGTLGRLASSAFRLRQQISMALAGGGGNDLVTAAKSPSLARVDTGEGLCFEWGNDRVRTELCVYFWGGGNDTDDSVLCALRCALCLGC